MIEWREVARDRNGLRIHRIDAEASGIPGAGSGGIRVPNPLELILARCDTPTVRWLRDDFTGTGAAVGMSSFSVACHVISLPEALVVVDSTYRTTAPAIFPPKRMALRDIELLAERIPLIEAVLEQHREEPMRVVDLAWGGRDLLPVWKVEGSVMRLVIAHDEAAAWVQDLRVVGDLQQVEPERYIATGRRTLFARIEAALDQARDIHGHLEFRSRGRSQPGQQGGAA